jgi:hypothetical protein
MKLIQLLLISTALALISQVAQATVVNLADDLTTDINCTNFDPSSPSHVQNCWKASELGATGPDNTIILDAFAANVPGFNIDDLLYKAEEGNPTDLGTLASSYQTTFSNDNEFATISHAPGQASVDCSVSCFLLVKDGVTPFAYLFMLSLGWDSAVRQPLGDPNAEPSWDGTALLEIKNFWSDDGGISYVALYSADVSEVPIPAAFWLFGTALMCFIGLSRSTRV